MQLQKEKFNKFEIPTLYNIISLLPKSTNVLALLRDLCTPPELRILRERLTIALYLQHKPNFSYKMIKNLTGSSVTTIMKVNHVLQNKICNGYKTILPQCNIYTSLEEALLKTGTAERCKDLISDLCTTYEINIFETRLVVAYLLSKGSSNKEIINFISVSTATLTRIRRFLNYENNRGYTAAFHLFDKYNCDNNTAMLKFKI
ncbi:YerC/YecD family TrpR-related protein [Candidatus Fokinia solitaria]|nr:YerC/YecD family TrpR-related protein [Candidatus Fokinia solitaria]